jgi:cytidylate kinase
VIVAIDGPAGAGKSTVARRLAERLAFRYLDTGAMYRALTWLALERGADLDDEPALAELARAHPITFGDDQRVLVDETDVTAQIRQPRIDKVVSKVARHHEVREVMRARQRELGRRGNVVIEGRDIGTIVAPRAEVKVYLNADESERARRRIAERPGLAADALATDLRVRDANDAAQLRPAQDAERIDTTSLSIEDVVARIEQLVHERHPVGP